MRISAHLAVVFAVFLLSVPQVRAERQALAPPTDSMCQILLSMAFAEPQDGIYELCVLQEGQADASPPSVQFAAAMCKPNQPNVKFRFKCDKNWAKGKIPCANGLPGECCEVARKAAVSECGGQPKKFQCKCSK